jgi:hypothetical protein
MEGSVVPESPLLVLFPSTEVMIGTFLLWLREKEYLAMLRGKVRRVEWLGLEAGALEKTGRPCTRVASR